MRRQTSLLLLSALAGCSAFNPGVDAFTAQGTAYGDSFRCAQRAVSDLGYAVSSLDVPHEYLRASQDFDRGGADGEYTRGYLTVSVDRERDHRLRVDAERFAEGGRRVGAVGPRPEPMPRPPGGRPRPYDTTDVIGRSRPRSSGPRRVNPGPTVRHAREVVRRCSFNYREATGTE
jgi:hypothetical protein